MLIVFPGQGAQNVGMGKDVYDVFPSARGVFQEVDDAISQKLSQVIFQGTEEELKMTQNAQPALMTVSVALLRVLEKEFGCNIGSKASFFAGHSLGEYSALCASGVISLGEAAKVLKIRGNAMANAHPNGGAMAAIIGLDLDVLKNIVAECSSSQEIVQIANDNSAGQIVISGSSAAVEKAMEKSLASNAKMAKLLEVSGPFHSKLMAKAVDSMSVALEGVHFQKPAKPIISNVTARAETNNFKELLLRQLTEMVRWRESLLFADANYVSYCLEIGPGKILTGLAKRTMPHWKLVNINSLESLENFAKNYD
ncbi:MAG: ACP S-malonyltransferase [Holosporaceae bacterium]|jgi:[acyl-carrier-protein] S-malonyltransferase|nr:ACP S-malonyltransferase [Holosporaceae bacterium]